ncbi:hypothetical protein EON62_03095 [archaeon]|nr:MAG: hypothetical protein EON62_03095 [archaeon]
MRPATPVAAARAATGGHTATLSRVSPLTSAGVSGPVPTVAAGPLSSVMLSVGAQTGTVLPGVQHPPPYGLFHAPPNVNVYLDAPAVRAHGSHGAR